MPDKTVVGDNGINYCGCVQQTYKLIACTLKWLLWRLGPGWWPLSADILKVALAHLDGYKTKSVCRQFTIEWVQIDNSMQIYLCCYSGKM